MSRPVLLTLALAGAVILAGCEKKSAAPAAASATPAATAAAPAPSAAPGPVMPANAAATPGSTVGAARGGAMAGMPRLKVACAADIQKFCAGSEEKPGRCLRPHRAELSAGCAQAMAERRAARMARLNGGGAAAPAQ